MALSRARSVDEQTPPNSSSAPVGDEPTRAIGPLVPGRHRPAAQDHDLVDEFLHHDVSEPVGGRHRVVVAAIADQRRRRDPARALLARLQRHRGQRAQHRKVGLQTLADGFGMPPGVIALAATAALGQHGIEGVEACRLRDRRHEVGPSVFDQTFNLAFVVALAGAAKAVRKQVVADQLGERPRPLALAVAADLATAILRLSYRIDRGTPPKNANDATCPSRNASVVSHGYALTKQASDCGRSMQKKWIFCRTPRSRPQPRRKPPGRALADVPAARMSPGLGRGRSARDPSPPCSRQQSRARRAAAQRSAWPYAAAGRRAPVRLEDRVVTGRSRPTRASRWRRPVSPGGSENRHIFSTVSRLRPNTRAASRRLWPSTNTKRRTAA